jgi:lipopolysaccharide transport system ATP-binding protein
MTESTISLLPCESDRTDPPIIVVDNVWKRYPRSEHRPSLRHEAIQMLKHLIYRHLPAGQQTEPFFALKGISFCVNRSETIGIVGRNGSGKTTLLKLLSGVTQPTQGRVLVRERFAALIGLGIGFSMERTGRENIYLNAAIQGVHPRQTDSIIDEIIRFAELEQFIDMAVKLYSSGMMSRLAFSIAIHIVPDIIFLDEVLAVGDMSFQAKCIDRILSFKAEKRTLLFVSHSPDQVKMLCDRTLWLNNGELVMDGETENVLSHYEAAMVGAAS